MPNVFDFNPTSINPFPYWKWNKVLPAVYDDSLSQYEILCKLLDTVNNIITSTNSTGEQVEQLTQLVQQLIDGKFPSGIVQYVTDIANAAIDDDIDTINDTIDALEAQVNSYNQSLQGQINSLNTSLTSQINTVDSNLQGQITTINNTLGTLSINKNHIIVLGDSLSRYSYQNNAVVNSGDELWTKVAGMTGVTVHNFSVGGAGFVNTTYTTSTIGVQANQAIADTSIDPDNVRCIVIFAGTNDYSSINNISTMQTAVRTVWNTFGNSRFSGIPIYFVFDQAGYVSHYTQISNLIYGLSESNYHSPVKGFNANSWLRWFDNIGNDGVHPNTYGYNTLAYKLAQIVTTGDVRILEVPIHTAPNPYNAEILGNKVVYDGNRLYIRQFYAIPTGDYMANSGGAVMLNIPRFASVLANDYMSNYYTPIAFPSSAIANLVTDPYKFMGIMTSNSDGSVDVKLSHPAFTSPSYQTRIMMQFDIPC